MKSSNKNSKPSKQETKIKIKVKAATPEVAKSALKKLVK